MKKIDVDFDSQRDVTAEFSVQTQATIWSLAAGRRLIGVSVPRLQTQFATATGPVSDWAQTRFGGFSTGGVSA